MTTHQSQSLIIYQLSVSTINNQLKPEFLNDQQSKIALQKSNNNNINSHKDWFDKVSKK